jgi:hypothetical protein
LTACIQTPASASGGTGGPSWVGAFSFAGGSAQVRRSAAGVASVPSRLVGVSGVSGVSSISRRRGGRSTGSRRAEASCCEAFFSARAQAASLGPHSGRGAATGSCRPTSMTTAASCPTGPACIVTSSVPATKGKPRARAAGARAGFLLGPFHTSTYDLDIAAAAPRDAGEKTATNGRLFLQAAGSSGLPAQPQRQSAPADRAPTAPDMPETSARWSHNSPQARIRGLTKRR